MNRIMVREINNGDEVICYDASGFDMGHITEGDKYIVESVEGVNVQLVGVKFSVKAWRFTPPSKHKR